MLSELLGRALVAARLKPRRHAPAAARRGDDEVGVEDLLVAARGAVQRADADHAPTVAEQIHDGAAVAEHHVVDRANPTAHAALDGVDIDMRYASRHVRLRPGALAGDKVVLDGAMPGRARGIPMVNEEGDRWVVTVYGYGAAEQPPTDHDGFLAFVATVEVAEVAAAVAQAEQLDEIATFATPASVLRRYDRLRRFPDGLLVMGDAICAFNPVYGQGMTVAAMEAEVLQRCLRDGDRRLPRRFFRGTRAVIQQAWKLSTGGDLALPEVPQRAALPDRIVNRYMLRLLAAAQRDAALTRVFVEMTGMIAPVTKLLSPKMMLRVLRGSLRGQGVVDAQSPRLVNAPDAPVAATPAASSSSETSSAALHEAA